MANLLDELQAEEAARGSRRVHAPDEKKEPEGFPKLQSLQQFMDIWRAEIRRTDIPVHMPDDETIARMRGSGWQRPGPGGWHDPAPGVDCHRYEVETLTYVVDDLIGKKHVITARAGVLMALDRGVTGTLHNMLASSHATNNGMWVPVELAFRHGSHAYLDGKRAVKFTHSFGEGTAEPLTNETMPVTGVNIEWAECVNVSKETFQVIIRWADLRNAPTARLDPNGNVVQDLAVKVEAPGTDPRLAEAILALAQATARNAPTPDEKARALAEAEVAPFVVPEDKSPNATKASQTEPGVPRAEAKTGPKWAPKATPDGGNK